MTTVHSLVRGEDEANHCFGGTEHKTFSKHKGNWGKGDENSVKQQRL